MGITLSDVAKKAGVSLATADRVMNQRGRVKQTNINKVLKAAKELGYTPNKFAQRLSRNHPYKFAFFLPLGGSDFIRSLSNEIHNLQNYMDFENIQADIFYINIQENATEEIFGKIKKQYDGYVIYAADRHDFNQSINHLSQKAPVLTLISDAPSSSRYQYIGINNMAAGRTAARLIGGFLHREPGNVNIVLILGENDLNDSIERKAGFEKILFKNFSHFHLIPPLITHNIRVVTYQKLMEAEAKYGTIDAIYSTSAGNKGVMDFLENKQSKVTPIVIAHELTKATYRGLMGNRIHGILCQSPKAEIHQSMQILMKKIMQPYEEQFYQPIDINIYTQDNVPNLGIHLYET